MNSLYIEFTDLNMQSVSDILKLFDLNKFKQRISLSTELCLTYSRKQAVNDSDIALNIGIPHEYLKSWYDLKQSGKFKLEAIFC